MTNKLFGLLFLAFTLPACAQYSSPESVCFDEINGRWIISNAGNGRILQRTIDGNVSNFATNLGAPKGLCIVGDTLYVADETRIRGYWLANRQSIMNVSVPNSTFLNDVASDGEYLYVTDMTRNKISRMNLESREIETIVDQGITSPNGIYFDGENNRLLLVSYRANSPVQEIDLTDNSVGVVIDTQLSNLDGITRDGNGNWYVSSWGTNAVYRFQDDFSDQTLLQDSLDGPADIYYDTIRNILGIPCMSAHQVIFRDTPPPQAELNSPREVNFGEVDNHTVSVEEVLWRNTGSEDLFIDSVQHSSEVFSLEVERNLRIAPDRSVGIPVTFSPEDTIEYVDTVWIYSNEPRSPRRMILIGAGFPSPWLGVPEGFDFGRVWIDEIAEWEMQLNNNGELELYVDSIGSSSFAFTARIPNNHPIQPGSRIPAIVNFRPGFRQVYEDTLYVYSSDPSSPAMVSVTGQGVQAPTLDLPEAFHFGSVLIGETASHDIIWWNTGDDTLIIDSTQVSGQEFFGLQLPDPMWIVPGDTTASTMEFIPQVEGLQEGIFSIYSNDPNSPTILRLQGSGQSESVEKDELLPHDFAISEAFPSPFNSAAKFTLSLPIDVAVNIGLYDTQGRTVRQVVNRKMEAGVHAIAIDGKGLTAGTFFLKGAAGEFRFNRQVVYLK